MKRTVITLMALLLLALPLLAACEGGDEETPITPANPTAPAKQTTPPAGVLPSEPVKIVIGLLTDLTGPGATALEPMKMAVEDVVLYINDNKRIPGVELELVTYDTQYDASRDIPGYEWLKERGAKIIVTPQPHTAAILNDFAEDDQTPICTWAASKPLVEPPGWVFCASGETSRMVRTMLNWISEQWPSYPAKPKIATCGIAEPNQMIFGQAVKEYCEANTDRFDYVGDYLASFGTMTWINEVDQLKDSDYIGHNQAMITNATFIQELRDAGSEAKIFSLDAMAAGRGMFVDMVGWEHLDGSLNLLPWGWWGGSYETVELAEGLLDRYRQGDASEIIRGGSSYLAVYGPVVFFDILRETVEKVGPENFNGQAFYDTALSFSATYDGIPKRGFAAEKRHFPAEGRVYEWDAETQNLIPVTNWLPEIE